MQEQRYKIDMSEQAFDKLSNYNSVDYREDWYFANYRIRHMVQKGPNKSEDGWYRIDNSQASQVTKKKIKITPMNTQKLDQGANFKLRVESKRPFYDGVELYLERVKIYKAGKYITSFITTETESVKDEANMKFIAKINGIRGIQKLGPISLQNIVKEILKK